MKPEIDRVLPGRAFAQARWERVWRPRLGGPLKGFMTAHSRNKAGAPLPSPRRSRHFWDRVAATVILLVAVILLVTSIGYGLFQGDRPGPGLFPAIMASLLLLVSAAWLITGAGPSEDANVTPAESDVIAPDGKPDDDSGDETIDAAGIRRVAFVVAWTAVPLVLLDPFGYVITMTLYAAGLLAVMARVRLWVAVFGALVGAVATGLGADTLGIVLPDPLGILQLLGA